jgi:hypothetical protein
MNLIFDPSHYNHLQPCTYLKNVLPCSLRNRSLNANEFVSTRSARASRIDSEIMVVADRVFGLVGLISLGIASKEDFAAPFVSVSSWCSLQSIDDTDINTKFQERFAVAVRLH